MKLYVGTYKKYNEGSLEGAWLDLDDYSDKDEFLAACFDLHKDEDDPELMFQDFEYDDDCWCENLYCESCVPDDYWDIKEELEKSYISDEVYNIWLKWNCEKPSVDNVEKCEKQYCGHYSSGEDYAVESAEESGELNRDCWLTRYINWSDVWRDMTYVGYYEDDGHIFCSNR